MKQRSKSYLAGLLVLLWLVPSVVFAQTLTVEGTVHDETGAPLIDKLDNGLSTEPSPYTGVYYGKDGLTEKEKMLLTKAAFQAQVDYALAVASGAVKEIKEGYVLPTGLAGGRNLICSYCEAKSVCRHAKQTVRAQKQVSSEDIHTIMTENKEPENAD